MDLRAITLMSSRLLLRSFTADDAAEAFAVATPSVTRFMAWDPSPSLDAFEQVLRTWLPRMESGTDLFAVVRLKKTHEFLGMSGVHGIGSHEPELGIWIKEQAHGFGYGREAVATIISWAGRETHATSFCYPVAVENRSSRRLAECLGGSLAGPRPIVKPGGVTLDGVVYRIRTTA